MEKPNYTGANIAVIGDVIVDKFINVKFTRPSAEDMSANCYEEVGVIRNPGGAGCTARCVRALGGNVELYAVTGSGSGSRELGKELKALGIEDMTIRDTGGGRPTTFKVRYVNAETGRQLMVAERQTRAPVEKWIEDSLLARMRQSSASVIIISDYDRGVVTPVVARGVCDIAKETSKQVICDGRPRPLAWYEANTHDILLFKGNLREVEHMLGRSIRTEPELDMALNEISQRLRCNVMVTLSQKGMIIQEMNGDRYSLPALNPKPICVSGAGDTVAATIALSTVKGYSLRAACNYANIAAAITCANPGAEVVSLDKFYQELEARALG